MDRLLFLGVGSIARALRAQVPGCAARGSTRKAPDERFTDIEAIATHDTARLGAAAEGAHVVVSFPPDGHTDQSLALCVSGAASVVYLSSTAVYTSSNAVITETSPVDGSEERARLRLQAERVWRSAGASLVRLPAFYGPSTGLHLSLARSTFRMPGRGDNVVSRVHVDDAVRFVLAALTAPKGSLLLAGDDQPAPVAEVVAFVCALFQLPAPEVSEGTDIPASLRHNRRIDNRRTKGEFEIRLAYPTYREGYRAIHQTLIG